MSFFTYAYQHSRSTTSALNALRFVVEFGQVNDVLGHEPDMLEYATFHGVARSLAYRRREAYRTCFPHQEPITVWEIAREQLKGSVFEHADLRGQAVFVGSLVSNVKKR